MPDDEKPAKVPVHLPPAAAALIRRAAARRHKSQSGYIRDAAVAEALRDETEFSGLDERDAIPA